MRILLFNLVTDASDPVLGFGCVWIRELARHCDAIDVLTMYQGETDFPEHVRVFSAGRERDWSKARRLAQFYRLLTQLLAARRYDACFAHMMPLFAGLGGPLLRARGVPLVLWYAHRQPTKQLRLGLAMSWRAVTSVGSAFPFKSDKLRVVGQGIDTGFYAPASADTATLNPYPHQEGGTSANSPDQQTAFPSHGGRSGDAGGDADKPLVLQVARLAAIKHQTTTIKALDGMDARLAFVGGIQAGYPPGYGMQLRHMAAELLLPYHYVFTGDLPPREVREWYRRATVAVNTSPVGLFDKTALESMSCAAPTIVCNPAFAPLLGEHRDLLMTDGPDDVDGLRDRIGRLLAMTDDERGEIGKILSASIMREHSLNRLIANLLSVMQTGELPQA